MHPRPIPARHARASVRYSAFSRWAGFGRPAHEGAGIGLDNVARRFKQGEAKRILLGTEHAADQPFPILSHPITPAVFSNFEVVRR